MTFRPAPEIADHPHDGLLTQVLTQLHSHATPDTDVGIASLHHTIGAGAFQSASGSHGHSGLAGFIEATADQTISNQSILQNDSELFFPLLANKRYFFEMRLLYNSANATMDWHCGWSLPALVTGWMGLVSALSTADQNWNSPAVAGFPTGLASILGTSIAGSFINTFDDFGINIDGWMFVGANAGTALLKWAQNTANAGNLIRRQGSFIRYFLLG